jgi:hypothetical protein
MVETPKALLIVGAAAAFRFAVAVLPVPPLVELTAPVVLVKLPAAVAVTFTLSVQLAVAATVPPLNVTLPEPATAVAVPPQVFVNTFGVATTVPAGNVSVKATPLRATVFATGLVIVKVSEVVPFTATPVAPYALAIVGAAMTVSVAVLLVAPAPVCVDEIAPVIFDLVPAAVPVTFTVIAQLLFVVTVAPVSVTIPVLATAAAVPPQVFASAFGVDTTKPAGNVSAKATPVRAAVLDTGLVIVKVSEVEPFSRMLAAPNASLIVGKPTTVSVAEAVLPVPPLLEVTAPEVFE